MTLAGINTTLEFTGAPKTVFIITRITRQLITYNSLIYKPVLLHMPGKIILPTRHEIFFTGHISAVSLIALHCFFFLPWMALLVFCNLTKRDGFSVQWICVFSQLCNWVQWLKFNYEGFTMLHYFLCSFCLATFNFGSTKIWRQILYIAYFVQLQLRWIYLIGNCVIKNLILIIITMLNIR